MMIYLLSPILTCVVSMTPTPDELTNYINCRQDLRQIQVVSDWQPLIQQHFKDEDVVRALKIIYCESRGRPNAVGKNTNGTLDIGLWQFNDNTWAWLKGKLKFTGTRSDPILSTKVAKWLIYNDGWYHWNSSKHCWGKYASFSR